MLPWLMLSSWPFCSLLCEAAIVFNSAFASSVSLRSFLFQFPTFEFGFLVEWVLSVVRCFHDLLSKIRVVYIETYFGEVHIFSAIVYELLPLCFVASKTWASLLYVCSVRLF